MKRLFNNMVALKFTFGLLTQIFLGLKEPRLIKLWLQIKLWQVEYCLNAMALVRFTTCKYCLVMLHIVSLILACV